MFKITQEVVVHADLDKSVSHGTHRPQDLIPAFLEVLKDTPEYKELKQPIPSTDDDPWWESEECSEFLNETLFDLLDKYAPEGYYFGAHEGDGSDFGYWEIEPFEAHGSYTVSNAIGYEVMISDDGEQARVRFWSDTEERWLQTGWLSIEYMDIEDPDDPVQPVIDPEGLNIPLNQVMKI